MTPLTPVLTLHRTRRVLPVLPDESDDGRHLRHQPRSTPLWVGDPDDWALVRQTPRPPLVCPEPGCDVELISSENLNNQYNPRIFKFKSAGASCNHWVPHIDGGGGPHTRQNQGMKKCRTCICTI